MELHYKKESAWKKLQEAELEAVMAYGDRYKQFLDKGKTERLAHDEAIGLAEARGFEEGYAKLKSGIHPGDKLYFSNRGKAVAFFVMGHDLEAGMNIVGAHIDAPRLDLKQQPLFEEGGMAQMRTHYYGGVKKYQWTAMPLSMHGVAFTKEGQKCQIHIGEREGDPVFFINDLLPHLSADQNKKPLSEGISGEQLTVVVGSRPLEGAEDSPIKAGVLKYLNETYGLVESDFVSAEIEILPQAKAQDVGFDRSMIAAYGQDDRICSYAALEGILEVHNPQVTAVTLLVDKEEIGSVGATGMHSEWFDLIVDELLFATGKTSHLAIRRAYAKTRVLSADVTACYDPSFPEVSDKQNSAILGHGVAISKYTGSRGKSGSNDADAEFVYDVTKVFDDAGAIWQTAELGKVDQGGGGTIAYILANRGAHVIDCGAPVLSMHAPIELTSKVDAYMCKKAYGAFLQG